MQLALLSRRTPRALSQHTTEQRAPHVCLHHQSQSTRVNNPAPSPRRSGPRDPLCLTPSRAGSCLLPGAGPAPGWGPGAGRRLRRRRSREQGAVQRGAARAAAGPVGAVGVLPAVAGCGQGDVARVRSPPGAGAVLSLSLSLAGGSRAAALLAAAGGAWKDRAGGCRCPGPSLSQRSGEGAPSCPGDTRGIAALAGPPRGGCGVAAAGTAAGPCRPPTGREPSAVPVGGWW